MHTGFQTNPDLIIEVETTALRLMGLMMDLAVLI